MASQVPSIRQINWMAIIPQLAIAGLLMYLWRNSGLEFAVLTGALTYLLLSLGLKHILAKSHRQGITKVRAGHFKEAIQDFKDSYHFFKKNEWIDKYRFVTLLSSSKMSYTEMALSNIAFCYGQIGDGQKSKEYYEKTLVEFPESLIAKTALRLLASKGKK